MDVGDKVTVKYGATDYYGTSLCSFVYDTIYDVIQVGGRNLSDDRIVIGFLDPYAVTAAMCIDDLEYEGSDTSDYSDETPETEEVPQADMPSGETDDALLARLLGLATAGSGNVTGQIVGIDGSAVQYESGKYASDSSDDYYGDIDTSISSTMNEYTRNWLARVDRKDPSIIQNNYAFPAVIGTDNRGVYQYDYYRNYERDGMLAGLTPIKKAINLDYTGRETLFKKYVQNYNKYKVANPNDALSRSFAHVFFVRPDCNVLTRSGGGGYELPSQLQKKSMWYYAYKHSPELLHELCQDSGFDNDFMFLLSNSAKSFQISDEYIKTDEYGKGLTGYKIPYGMHDVESKTSDTFSITYEDDRDLHIYQLHKLWIDYISGVYRGKYYPRDDYLTLKTYEKTIDYSSACYYILTAEDGETIIFWSKYYGVFPTNASSNTFSWSKGTLLSTPDLDITYKYAWKEDFDPLTLVEFNGHSSFPSGGRYTYTNSYQSSILGTGNTWGGSPFIETFNGNGEIPYTFKLRFRPDDGTVKSNI